MTAFWTDSKALPAVATALWMAAAACSVPFGAFFTALSTRALICFWASVARPSATLVNWLPKPVTFAPRPMNASTVLSVSTVELARPTAAVPAPPMAPAPTPMSRSCRACTVTLPLAVTSLEAPSM